MGAILNEDTIEDIQEKFDIFDKLGDKKIESHQVIDVLRTLGMSPIAEDVAKMLKASDLEKKRVDLETFCSIYQQLQAQPVIATVDEMIEALKTFDKNNSGCMSSASLRAMLINLGDKLTESEAEVIMSKFEDDKAQVKYEDMVKAIASGKKL